MTTLSTDFGVKALLLYLKEYKAFIVYCIADGLCTDVYFDNGEMRQVSCNIGAVEKVCPYHYLFRIHKSVSVNFYCIEEINLKWRCVLLDHWEMFLISDRVFRRLTANLNNLGYEII